MEINIPVADPDDPYAVPAAMPSSADTSPRSFDVADFAAPTRRQDDWRFTPIDRIPEFFEPFAPSGETRISVGYIDGSPLDDDVDVREVAIGEAPCGAVGKPSDRAAAVEWNSARSAWVVELKRDPAHPVLVRVHGEG
ncbi:MAG: Fe-S cluster assembly protein SufD, partial [Bifidobacterium choerinum]